MSPPMTTQHILKMTHERNRRKFVMDRIRKERVDLSEGPSSTQILEKSIPSERMSIRHSFKRRNTQNYRTKSSQDLRDGEKPVTEFVKSFDRLSHRLKSQHSQKIMQVKL